MDSALFDVFNEAGRLLFLGLLPTLVVIAAGSFVASALQAAVAIQDSSFSFAVRLIALLLALYFFLPSVISSLLELAKLSFGI
jgi:type III secretory pathway component EscS